MSGRWVIKRRRYETDEQTRQLSVRRDALELSTANIKAAPEGPRIGWSSDQVP